MFSVVYGLYPGNLTVPVSSVYAALGHTGWAIGVSFIVIQCCTGYARMIDSLLSLKLIYPLSRLTYCAYLVHPVIMMVTVSQMDGPLHLHNNIVVSLRRAKQLSSGPNDDDACLGESQSVRWFESGRVLVRESDINNYFYLRTFSKCSLFAWFSSWSCTLAIWSPPTWCRSAFPSRSRRPSSICSRSLSYRRRG